MPSQPPTTVEEFDIYALLPENRKKLLQFFGGQVHEVIPHAFYSIIGARMCGFMGMYIFKHDLGYVTSANGGYCIGNERYIPDMAFISYARLPEVQSEAGYIPVPPELAVEVFSPGNTDAELRLKIAGYLSVGTVVWVVNHKKQVVEVYAPDEAPRILRSGDTLDGGSILPGFALAVDAIFKDLR
ncbi:MAG: Uma2 family endonuclease [Anaerolineae bacterium]|nr:Uma2 family endonuclease [Anaerolineae bacterium]